MRVICVISLLSLCLSTITAAPAGSDVISRQEDEHEHHGHDHHHMPQGDDDAIRPPETASSIDQASSISTPALSTVPHPPEPDHHAHGSHAAPKAVLDDESIHYWHHFPPSYLAADFKLDKDSAIFGEEFDDEWDPQRASGHKSLMLGHVLAMIGAYFGALPISLALRAAQHSAHVYANIVFLVLALAGWLAGAAYRLSSPDRYEGDVHRGLGDFVVVLSLVLGGIDVLWSTTSSSFQDRSWTSPLRPSLWKGGNDRPTSENRYEMVGYSDRAEDLGASQETEDPVFVIDEDEDVDSPEQSAQGWSGRPSLLIRQRSPESRHSRHSVGSDGTLQDSPGLESHHKDRSRIGAFDELEGESLENSEVSALESGRRSPSRVSTLLTWIRRSQVVIAYVTLLTGLTTYTGMCRAGYINSCAAHFVKGSIFFGYGVLTFARYLGAYADLGWAWNKPPGGRRGPSAEMVECSVIFLYGITNTWMERFGSSPQDPYTVKQVQHISIAVMFWFAGLTGILLESRKMRRVLGAVLGGSSETAEPPSYAFSFNPLPAVVIAVTGMAMAAHHQDYEFQVSIHSLWGTLLAGGSLFRLCTYFFLWLRPPVESTLPSRPPTEILTSLGYAAGGIVFMLSVEEVSFAAMRAGYDDMMAFLNFTIALTSLVFCWAVVVMAIKGWAVMRVQARAHRQAMGDHEQAVI